MAVRMIIADVIDGLRQMADSSVECAVTSPPYWGLRSMSARIDDADLDREVRKYKILGVLAAGIGCTAVVIGAYQVLGWPGVLITVGTPVGYWGVVTTKLAIKIEHSK